MTGFPGGSGVKNLSANAGEAGLIPGLGRSPGEGNGNPLPDSCLENSMDRRTWRAIVHRVTKNWTHGDCNRDKDFFLLETGKRLALNDGLPLALFLLECP